MIAVRTMPATDLVARATLAPSSHNTQPWRFEAFAGEVRIFADRTRALPVHDPYDRELTISCGAALLNLRLAARFGGAITETELLPDPDDPDLLAVLRVTGRQEERDPAVIRLFRAMPARRTCRERFSAEPVPPELPGELLAAARAEGAWLVLLDDDQRAALATLVDEGDRLQFADPCWRRELAMWLHPRRSGDGLALPGGPFTRAAVRGFDLGPRTGARDATLARDAPLLAVLGTDGDTERDWLTAGQALQRVLLRATAWGVQSGHLNQPIQVAALRPRLAGALGRPDACPQVALRLGVPRREPEPSPRRPLEDVLRGA